MLVNIIDKLHSQRIHYLVVGIALFAVSSCGIFPKMIADIETDVISISAVSDANGGYPIAVDIVVLNDSALVQAVQGMSAKNWFQGKEQFILDHREASTVILREVVPGKTAPKIELERSVRVNALSVFAFANYINEGSHRLTLGNIEQPQIVLEKTTLRLAPK
ncbi:MAG: hypothetical protein HN701_15755 [Rhodospirillaceae bacterium]|nr:hypothetical protein [Rhodospirillaceae bacterium]